MAGPSTCLYTFKSLFYFFFQSSIFFLPWPLFMLTNPCFAANPGIRSKDLMRRESRLQGEQDSLVNLASNVASTMAALEEVRVCQQWCIPVGHPCWSWINNQETGISNLRWFSSTDGPCLMSLLRVDL